MSERRKNIGTVLMSVGGIIIIIEIVGILTDTIGGPEIFYFLGGLLDGLGVVFFLGGYAVLEEYRNHRKNTEMM
ncbi:MAG: hypothetical protein ACFFEE_01960 [Candidatus Thorarchaeota archaeon]